jgi:uncharacterized membrane protein YraQ (UPF0718 family)
MFSGFSWSWSYFATFCVGMFLLYWVVFVLAMWVKNYASEIRVERWFPSRLGIGGNFLGALFGAITPFCSCTTVPIFMGMIESEIRLGYAISFMIASPMINPPALVVFCALFGWKTMLVYIAAAYLVAVLGGILLGTKKNQGRLIESLFIGEEGERLSLKEASLQYLGFMKKFAFVIVLAAAVAAWLRGWSPPPELLGFVERQHELALPLTVLIGGAIYADIGILVPIGSIFQTKGIDLGLVMAFMMSASGVGLPSIILLTRIFKLRLLAIYLLVVFCLITATGYLISYLL